jgi:hypothetical protein
MERAVTGEQLQKMMSEVLPERVIRELVGTVNLQERQRKLDALALVRSLVLTGGTPGGGRQVDVLRHYQKLEAPKVARGAFYAWFTEKLGILMTALGTHACAYARAMPVHLPGPLAMRRDWRAIDSTTIKLPDALKASFPGTGDYASLKVHKEYSLGVENVVDYHITPGRDHDGPELRVDASRRGTGLVVDLGYASQKLVADCRTHDVFLVMKWKSGWRVFLDQNLDDRDPAWLSGRGLQGLQIGDRIPETAEGDIDIDVTIGPDDAPIPLRLVGVHTEKGQVFFLTTIPRSAIVGADVATIYRLRWCIELDNKLSKSACRLDDIGAETDTSALILVHAAMIASILSNAIVHADHLNRGAVGDRKVPFTKAPLHSMAVAKMLAASAWQIAEMMGDPETTPKAWERVAGEVRHMGIDPNWRSKPSVMDIVKGRVARPARHRRERRHSEAN